tara:strand:- start:3697 stop:4359 length:663 start_codon:yes stop_codon:yes gene_type:complete
MRNFIFNLNQKQKVALLAGAGFLFCAGMSFLVYSKLGERAAVLVELDSCAAEENLLQGKIVTISNLLEQRSSLIESTDRYAEILPAEEHVQHDAFVRVMDEYRRNTELLIKSAEYLSPGRPSEDKEEGKVKNFVRHRYRFRIVGSVVDLLQFMSRIENHKRFLKIDAVSLKPLGSRGDFPEGDLREKEDVELLEMARNPVKEIDLTVSTYTYFKGAEEKL